MRWLRDFGAWVAIAGVLATGLIGWGRITTQVEEHGSKIEKHETAVQDLKTDVAVLKVNSEAALKSLDRLEDRLGTKR